MISEQECVDFGGHCFKEDTTSIMLGDGQTIHGRECRHCGGREVGFEQPRIRWEPLPPKPKDEEWTTIQ